MQGNRGFNRWERGTVGRLLVALCLAVLSGCDFSGQKVVEGARQADAIRQSAEEALTARGAKVTLENLAALGMYVSAVDLSGVHDITDETFTLLKQMGPGWRPIMKINLSGTNITDEQMAKLDETELSQGVTKLTLRNTGISDKGLRDLKNMPSLMELDLTNTKVTAEGVQAFLKLRTDNPEIRSKKPKIKR
ncbi:MAG: hypothetical protein ACT4QC_24130 [Planctomycetaceae bacterium]